MMVARKCHAKLAEVALIRIVGERLKNIPDITFIDQDAKGPHMPHDDPLVMELSIIDCFVKRVFMNNGRSLDSLFLFILKKMKFHDSKIEKIKTNLVALNGESS